MQYRPEHIDLIEAIQEFLLKEVLPFVKEDDALSYKTLVSWNMLGVISRELRNGRALLEEDLATLAKLVNEESPIAANDRALWQSAQRLAKKLARQIREERIMPGSQQWQAVKELLRHNLQIANPRFTSD